MVNAVEDVDKLVSTSARIFSRLGSVSKLVVQCERRRIPTERRTPIPAKITLAGGNACKKIKIRAEIPRDEMCYSPAQHPGQWSQKMNTKHSQSG
jgi:hypothetical protein